MKRKPAKKKWLPVRKDLPQVEIDYGPLASRNQTAAGAAALLTSLKSVAGVATQEVEHTCSQWQRGLDPHCSACVNAHLEERKRAG